MIDVKKVWWISSLAEAAYANFDPDNLSKDSVKGRLQSIKKSESKDNFSEEQAQAFVNTWEVKSHLPNTASGFSATVFKNKEGQYEFVVRGTESPVDEVGRVDWVQADFADIGADGLALHQAI